MNKFREYFENQKKEQFSDLYYIRCKYLYKGTESQFVATLRKLTADDDGLHIFSDVIKWDDILNMIISPSEEICDDKKYSNF